MIADYTRLKTSVGLENSAQTRDLRYHHEAMRSGDYFMFEQPIEDKEDPTNKSNESDGSEGSLRNFNETIGSKEGLRTSEQNKLDDSVQHSGKMD